ncbi:MAG: sulfurtransferase TusA family protein [bacterium]
MEPAKTVNLLGEICPMTWVRTKLALEGMGAGEVLEVWLDEGEPAESVPQSAEAEGCALEAAAPRPGGGVIIRLRKPSG